ncbi:putative ATP-dependent helicase C23E6.02 [Hordeum vulgare]|nr:putative ATP-dependent helicase C23E6.02 [Hordeum vulgare]
MWPHSWSADRDGGEDDLEQKRYMASDVVWKRAPSRYTNQGLSPPMSLLRRETEEYDRMMAPMYSDAGSSSASGRSARALSYRTLAPIKREPTELLPLRTVKRELEAEAELELTGRQRTVVSFAVF